MTHTRSTAGASIRSWTGLAALYLGLAAVMTWPLALHLRSLLGSTAGPGDSYLNLWILGWDLRVLATRPLDVLSGRVFDANIFFPATGTLAYSDHLLLQSAALAPLFLATRDVVLCYNVLLLLSLAGSALAMHACVKSWTGSAWSGIAAGIAWGFAPYRFGHLIHLNLQALYFLPLALLFLRRAIAHGRAPAGLLLGATLGLQAIACAYYGVIGAVGLGAASLGFLIDAEPGRGRAALRQIAVAAVVFAVLAAPFAWQYWRVQQREGFGRTLFEATEGSARLGSYLKAPATSLLYGISGPFPLQREVADRKPTEQVLFPGFALTGLALIGLSAVRRRESRGLVAALALLAGAGLILSLGPSGPLSLYASLHRLAFGFQGIRAPARFGLLLLLGLAGLAGIGVDRLRRAKSPAGRAAAAGAIGLIALECANAPMAYVPAPVVATELGAWLQSAPEPGAVIALPLTLDPARNTTLMVQSLAHGRPLVNGSSAQRPSFYPALVDTMARFPSSESLRTLHDLPVRFIISPNPVEGAPLVERARFAEGVVYELRWTADVEADLERERLESVSAPRAGPAPFRVGESAVYSVEWTSGPLAAPAGQAVFTVQPGEAGAGYTFQAVGTTAPWISRFFQADDRFLSSVDAGLRPIAYRQHLREGRRTVERRVRFDRDRRLISLQQGTAPEVSLPIPRDSRDPLSAFYYVRALPLQQGPARIPINEAGRNLVLELQDGLPETIAYQGTPTGAFRVDARLIAAEGRPLPLRLTAWFSRDGRQVPLLIHLDGLAGAGSFRLALESFTGGNGR